MGSEMCIRDRKLKGLLALETSGFGAPRLQGLPIAASIEPESRFHWKAAAWLWVLTGVVVAVPAAAAAAVAAAAAAAAAVVKVGEWELWFEVPAWWLLAPAVLDLECQTGWEFPAWETRRDCLA